MNGSNLLALELCSLQLKQSAIPHWESLLKADIV
jgi:hypothetical protein